MPLHLLSKQHQRPAIINWDIYSEIDTVIKRPAIINWDIYSEIDTVIKRPAIINWDIYSEIDTVIKTAPQTCYHNNWDI